MAKRKFRQPARYYTDPNNSIGYLARVVFRSFSRLLEKRTLEHDVSAGQWRFLRQLWRKDGMTQRELSENVGMREPTTVIALKGLEAAGLVHREKSQVDRRKVHVFLTDRAKALESTLAPSNAEVHDMATRGMSDDEVLILLSLLRRVLANLADDVQKMPIDADLQA